MRPLPAPAAIPASARETRPKPSSTTSVLWPGGRPPPILPSWNAVWTRRAASAASASSTTKEMLSSDEPCAIAITLIREAESAVKTRAATPGVPAIPRPTTAITATP